MDVGQISSRIDDDTCCHFLQQLVGIESYSRSESAAVEFLINKFNDFGYDHSHIDQSGSAIGIRGNSQPDAKTIVLLGHIDTVPGAIPVRIAEGVLYGRGSVDAKGPLATFTVAGAMAMLPPSIRLVVAGAVEEESATSRGARQVSEDFRADYCVIGEPSSAAAITLGYKGRLLIDYEITVDEAHSAGPGTNAAEQATGFWEKLLRYAEAFNSNHQKFFDQLLPCLRSINSRSDGMNSWCTANIGCRLPPNFDVEHFRQELVALAAAASIRTYGYEPAHRSDRSNALVRALAKSIRDAGLKPGYKLKTGTADLNVVAPIWKCPIVAYGPGDSSLDHTPNEHIHLSEYLQAVRILKRAIETLANEIVDHS